MRSWVQRSTRLVGVTFLCMCACLGEDETSASIRATLRRTAHGIPHITAADYRGLGAGLGYAQAQDTVCILADQFLKVRGERARYLGPGTNDANIDSDLTYLGLGLLTRAQAAYDQQTPAVRELVEGFAAGYNHYLQETPPSRLPAPCTGAAWVKPIRGVDLLAYHLDLSMFDSTAPLLGYLAHAQPPGVNRSAAESPRPPALTSPSRETDLGSNGWAIGRDRSAGGGGMLLANPHFPWEGALRFYESHLTLPGTLDVYGASLLGVPVINIGFNRHVAWTHTVATSSHFVLYRLTLADDAPTTYLYDGQRRAMTRATRTIDVLQDDGSLRQVTRSFWRSHHGPLLHGPGLEWSTRTAYVIRDANEGNHRFAEQWLRMNTARSLADLAAADREARGIPWVNTIATSATGETRFVDASRVPNLSAETVAAYHESLQHDADTQALAAQRIVLLDGGTSRDEWVRQGGDPSGLVPLADVPQLLRPDFVMNANDSATYTNPAAPLWELPFGYETHAPTQGRISPRTHMNLALLTERGAASASGSDGRFTREELARALLDNRSWMADQLREAVVRRCQAVDSVDVEGVPVDLTRACHLLATWDGRFTANRTGALVWREFLGGFSAADLVDQGALFARPFDPARPLSTPSGLAPAPDAGPDPLLEKLGEAVSRLTAAGLRVDARLGEVQYTRKGRQLLPLSGGLGQEGVLNVVGYSPANSTLLPRTERGPVLSERTGLTAQGYPINNGTSFVLLTEFTRSGPRASALLTYSESTDPASPLSSDQTHLFSQTRLRPVLFDEADIQEDPALRITRLDLRPTER
ncbi:penicillin acylase family protein [Melittangium boletus]|uniref:penicillin acylase family protein n=1 Tax=Melittangium boletus TaxID=83453 RepID=UPI003DA2E000